jgi:hypothetical protein
MMSENKPSRLGGVAFRLGDWRERYREAGLSVILALQATFVVSPLTGTRQFSGEAVSLPSPRLVTLHGAVADPR